MEKSVTILAKLIGKKNFKLHWINKTNHFDMTKFDKLPNSLISNFKKNNELDYLIYNYALKKLKARIK